MARGGRRSGKPGVAYSNRSDLNAPLPAQALPDQPYGVAGQQLAAQKQLPMGPPGSTSPGAGLPSPGQPAPALPPPGSLPPLNAPTTRPNEPVTHGSPSGPGAGPEVLNLPSSPQTVGQMLTQLSTGPNTNPDIQFLSNYLSGGR